MRIKSIQLLLVCFLVFGLTIPSISCPPPDCGSCCYWEGPVPGGSCQLIPGTNCGDCSGCSSCYSCVICWCQCTSECCQNSDCTGECHNGCSNCSCVDDQSKCTKECHTCSDGSCEDDNTKCGTNQCCDNGTCVPKCDPNGAPCPHDNPVIQAGCQWQAPDDHRCVPDQVGKTCMWILQYEYTSSAICADCAPGCSRTRDNYCAFWKAETCRNAFFIGCVCDYDGPEIERPKVGSGDHYICN